MGGRTFIDGEEAYDLNIADGDVSTSQIENLAVTSAKVASDAVNVDKLAHNIDATGIGFDADKVDGVEGAVITGHKSRHVSGGADEINSPLALSAMAAHGAAKHAKWDISTAVHLQNFSVAGQDTAPYGISFKPDGTKMYVLGATGADVNEYNLGTPWNILTAVYLQNFSVATQDIIPHGPFFKPDGTKMYVLGADGLDVNEYNLGTPWNVSTASYLQNFSVATQEINPTGLFFKPDGTKMYVIGYDGDDVNEYDLGTAWNVTTASYLQNFDVSGEETYPTDVFFKSDGTKMYVIGGNGLQEYDLSTAWNVTTAVWLQKFSVAPYGAFPRGVFFKPDGTKMYIIEMEEDDVDEYDLL